ncbi:hypothetical protein [Neobacillus vireti]|uniref:hypothetical protein n=1 Tax=Neobacillus vireti TaxID=220686 RepID=UPI002FFEAD5F
MSSENRSVLKIVPEPTDPNFRMSNWLNADMIAYYSNNDRKGDKKITNIAANLVQLKRPVWITKQTLIVKPHLNH